MKRILFIILMLFVLGTSAYAQLSKPYFYWRGRDCIIEGKYREAIESLNMLLRVETKAYEGYFLRGVAKYNLDDLPGALADFTAAVTESPNYTLAYQYRAITRSRMGQYQEALMDFDRAIELRPSMAGSYYSRGVTFFLNQQFERAITDFDRFLRLEPREPSGYINRGTSYLYQSDTVRALSDYNRAIEVNPYFSDGYMRRGLVLLMQENFDQAIADFDKTIELDSTSAITYFYRGVANSNLDKLNLALHDFDSSIERDSMNSVTYYNRAILRSQVGDYNRAIEDYNRIAINNPNNVLVFYNRAALYAQIGNLKAAIADYSHAIELYPDFANAYLFRSNIRAMLRDEAGSREDRRVAEAKIAEYRSQLNDSTFSIYADTSQQFNKIMSFDADFGNKDFARSVGDIQKEVRLRPLFRFTIMPEDTVTVFDPMKYRNERLNKFIESVGVRGLVMSNVPTMLSEDSIYVLDIQNSDPEKWNDVFIKGITQTLLSQYNSAKSYFDYAVSDRPREPYGLINRSTTQAEMIEFISSLDGDYQNITIDSDPATRLKRSERRTYDYSKAIADLRAAIELMPELPYSHYNLGNLLSMSGDMPGAIRAYTRAIELFPYFAEAYFNRGLVQVYLKDSQTGCLDLSKAGELGITDAYEVVKRYCISK